MSCGKCKKSTCVCKVVSQRGLKGERGEKGFKGDKGDPGENGTAQTEVNSRVDNNSFTSSITAGTPTLNDPELTLTATANGKYIVCYSGSVKITANGDVTSGIAVNIRKNGVVYKDSLYTFNNAAVAYPVNQEEWKVIELFDTIDLLIGDVVDVQYARVANPAPNVNSTMVARGTFNLIKIA